MNSSTCPQPPLRSQAVTASAAVTAASTTNVLRVCYDGAWYKTTIRGCRAPERSRKSGPRGDSIGGRRQTMLHACSHRLGAGASCHCEMMMLKKL